MRGKQYRVKVIDYVGLTTWFGPYRGKLAKQYAAEFRRYGMTAVLEKAR